MIHVEGGWQNRETPKITLADVRRKDVINLYSIEVMTPQN